MARFLACFAFLFCSTVQATPVSRERPVPAPSWSKLLTLSDLGHGSIRNLGKNEQGSLVVESENFRVLHDQKPDLMEKIASVAERARHDVQRKWFGDAAFEWDGRCTIYLYASHARYREQTKQDGALAHARSLMRGDQLYRRTVHLPCDAPGLFEDVLPHEVAHTVMANRFNGQTPRWANEGLATLCESPASQEKWRRILRSAWHKDELFALDVLLQTDDPHHLGCVEYYAQSMSVIEYLVAQKGARTFTSFLKDTLRTDNEAALKKHYAIGSYGELSRLWKEFAFAGSSPTGNVASLVRATR